VESEANELLRSGLPHADWMSRILLAGRYVPPTNETVREVVRFFGAQAKARATDAAERVTIRVRGRNLSPSPRPAFRVAHWSQGFAYHS